MTVVRLVQDLSGEAKGPVLEDRDSASVDAAPNEAARAGSGADGFPLSALLAEFLPRDPGHFLCHIEIQPYGVRITAACKAHAFRNMKALIAVDRERRRTPLYYEARDRVDGLVIYRSFIPASLLNKRLTFYADRRDGSRTRVWTAAAIMTLPPGWYCTKSHLHLNFSPTTAADTVVADDWRHFVQQVSIRDQMLCVQFTSYGFLQPSSIELVIYKFRDEARLTSVPCEHSMAKKAFRLRTTLHRHYTSEVVFHSVGTVDLSKCFSSPGLYSVMVRVDGGRLRGLYPYNSNYQKKPDLLCETSGGQFRVIHHFQDRSTKNIRIEALLLQECQRDEALRLLDTSTQTPPAHKTRWLCGEYSTTARDNGWELFTYLREHRPDTGPAYVIDRQNHDGLVADGHHILEYGSIEHLRSCRHARVLLFTHHSLYLMPNLMRRATINDRTQPLTLFLQHGVLAIKPVLGDYDKRVCGYDLFNVSSERERDLVVTECRFQPEDVIVAGLPRWDRLHQMARLTEGGGADRRRRVLVFPTWRRRLDKLTSEEFRETNFFKQWKNALEALSEGSSRDGYDVTFCVHSIFERFSSAFATPGISQRNLRESVSELARYDVFLTDYSSLCFDFLYIKRPSIFFMFDKDEFFRTEPSYVDLDRLPGPVAENIPELQDVLARWASNEELAQDKVNRTRGDFIAYDDAGNCQRLVAIVEKRIQGDAEHDT